MRTSAGKEISLAMDSAEKVDLAEQQKRATAFPWPIKAQLTPGSEMQTYTLTSPFHSSGSEIRHLMLRPTDAPGATFEIESIRLVFRKEHLASIASGVAWQGLKEIYRESLAARAPEAIGFTITLIIGKLAS